MRGENQLANTHQPFPSFDAHEEPDCAGKTRQPAAFCVNAENKRGDTQLTPVSIAGNFAAQHQICDYNRMPDTSVL